jgi:hypothetical protein
VRLAALAQSLVEAVQAVLGAPGDLQHVVGLTGLAVSQRGPDRRLADVVPGSLDQQPTGVCGAGLGDRALGLSSALLGSLVSPGERERQEAEINELPAGLAAAGPALEDRLHQQHRLRECQADRGRKGFSRSSVRNPCDAVTSAVWWCHPSHERPS